MNQIHILFFYLAQRGLSSTPHVKLDYIEIENDNSIDHDASKTDHDECPHQTVEHENVGHGHGLHDLPGLFLNLCALIKIF